jgi:hypothetical protein
LQFGLFKNDPQNNGLNDNQGAVITQVLVTNASGVLFNDNFAVSFTNNYAWRVTDSVYVRWIPRDTVYWLKWTIPDNGFTPQSASDLTGTWADAGITNIITDVTGTNRFGAVPAVSLPAGPNAFFRLINTNAP